MKIKGRTLQKKLLAIIVMIAVCVCSVVTYNPDVYAADTSKGVVTGASSLNVRSGPGTSYSKVTTVKEGDVVTVLEVGYDDSGAAWYQISTADGTEGWVSATYISIKADTENFDEYIKLQGFPESYHAKLKALHQEFPNWIFEAQHTDIKWEDVIAGQYKLGMSLIQDSVSPSSWKSTQNGAYNWETSKWIELDSGGWVAASEALVEHYVDPRNFLDSANLFQFLKQSYDVASLSEEGIANVKANLETMVAGTFLAGECVEPEVEDDVEQEETDKEETNKEVKTYVDVLMKAGAESGVVPYVIASMILQEQGKNGTGKSISGTVEGYEGYYNFLNIGAYKSGNLSAVQKGLEYAKSKGWDTKEKSIIEGAIYYGESYVAVGQDTMYLKKFDLVGTLYTHQYMTNIQGAASEGQHLAEAYQDEETGQYSEAAQNTALTFKIPVYLNMPASPCKKPTGDGCPNYMLKNLEVAGESLTPTFSMYDTAYDLIVSYKNESVTIEATPQHSSAKIEGAGKVNLAVGENVFDIKVTAENGDERVYTLTIIREEYVEEPEIPDEPDNPDEPEVPDEPVVIPEPTLVSSVYKLSQDGFITGIKEFPVTAEAFQKNLTVTDGTMKVLAADGSELAGNVGTGAVVKLYNTEGEEKASYTVIIYGDTNGDGIINAKDLLVIQKNNIQVKALSGVYLTAADVTRDGKVNAKDLLLVQKNNIKVSTIEQ